MGFQTPLYKLSEYLDSTTSGKIQLPDFQRGYKWEDERIRSLLVTVLRGHPLGVVMLLKTGNDQVRFKPKPIEDRIDDAVLSLPSDGVIRSNFGKDIELDVSTPEKERQHGYFPVSLLFSPEAISWIFELDDREQAKDFHDQIVNPSRAYDIPAIELDTQTSKSAVATVFEKVNTGGLPLNVFELLTATFAGDKEHYDRFGTDFRLNDDWQKTKELFAEHPVLDELENTDFLQAVTLLATRKRHLADMSSKPAGISAKREDVLKLTLNDYLEWVDPLREAFLWVSDFLADRHIFSPRFLPYPKQLVPLAAVKVVMGADADLLGPRERLVRWFWCGILGELYGGAIETRFVRDLEQVPHWAIDAPDAATPRTIQDASFVESRLHSLRTRNAAAYKGIYCLLLANHARDWMQDKALDKVQYASLHTDIHHIFPQQWCKSNGIDDERRESIVNKTAIAARTNRAIGGSAPSKYLAAIESKAQIPSSQLDSLLESHLVSASALRNDDFSAFFTDRRERLCQLIEEAMGKTVQRDVDEGRSTEGSEQFEPEAEDRENLMEDLDGQVGFES